FEPAGGGLGRAEPGIAQDEHASAVRRHRQNGAPVQREAARFHLQRVQARGRRANVERFADRKRTGWIRAFGVHGAHLVLDQPAQPVHPEVERSELILVTPPLCEVDLLAFAFVERDRDPREVRVIAARRSTRKQRALVRAEEVTPLTDRLSVREAHEVDRQVTLPDDPTPPFVREHDVLVSTQPTERPFRRGGRWLDDRGLVVGWRTHFVFNNDANMPRFSHSSSYVPVSTTRPESMTMIL